MTPVVSIIMGSTSDLPVMEKAAKFLDEMEIPFEMHALSAHRTPAEVEAFAKGAKGRGIKVIIAAAGMAAHLCGVIASMTTVPVIGVPINSTLDGMDALLAIVQMPPGIPVATVGINGALNAGILAVQMLAVGDEQLQEKLSALFIFLGVMFYIDILKYFVGPAYYPGLRVVPIVMLGELFFGIYFNLSLWYKLIDQTRWGAYFSTIGCVATVSIILLFGPSYGYMACAWASFFCNLLMMLLSYFVGQKKFPIEYDLKSAFLYFGVATVLYVAGMALPIQSEWLRLGYRTILLGVFIAFMVKRDLPLRELPYVGRFFR